MNEMEKRLKATEDVVEELKKRLRVVEDTEEIKQLTNNYINCICFGTFDNIMDFFSKNVRLDLAKRSRPNDNGPSTDLNDKSEIEKFYKDLAKIHIGNEGTYVVHPIITVDGDKARGKWILYINYRLPSTGQTLFFIQTIFEPEYIKENGKWKFSVIKARERLGLPGGKVPVELFGNMPGELPG